MNDQLNKLPINKTIEEIKRFRLILFLGLFAGIYVYLLLFINTLNTQKASRSDIDAELQTVKRLNIDEESVSQMLRLTEENIEVKSLYQDARDNPFDE